MAKKYRKPVKRSRPSPERTLMFGMLLIAGLFLVVWGISMMRSGNSTNAAEEPNTAPVVGSYAPNFTAKTLEGKDIALRDYRGKPVVLNFWATWCPPCRAEMPLLQQYYTKHQGEYNMVAVNDAEPKEQVQAFIQQQGFTFTVALDPQQSIVAKYRIQGFPTTFFIDAEGVIRYMHVGMLDEATLQAGLKSIGITP